MKALGLKEELNDNPNYFHKIPIENRPRERIETEGVDTLQDQELLARCGCVTTRTTSFTGLSWITRTFSM